MTALIYYQILILSREIVTEGKNFKVSPKTREAKIREIEYRNCICLVVNCTEIKNVSRI